MLTGWPLSSPVTIRPAAGGVNNQTYYVDADGGSYVVRIYQNSRDPVRIKYEHAILQALAARSLTFRVPVPVVGHSGSTVVTLDDGVCAALFSRLPGGPPDRCDRKHLRACGAALAELHEALRQLDVGPPPPSSGVYGDLDHVHPFVPDAWNLPSTLPVSADQRGRLVGIFAELRAAIPFLYATLPFQICHNDYSPGNTLRINGRTSSILDFEFAAPDLRVIDVAVGWYWSVGDAWGTGGELAAVQAFLSGYTSVGMITPAESDAMSTVSLLQRATSLVHWAGRMRAGLSTDERTIEQAWRLLNLDRWLKAYGGSVHGLCTGPS